MASLVGWGVLKLVVLPGWPYRGKRMFSSLLPGTVGAEAGRKELQWRQEGFSCM